MNDLAKLLNAPWYEGGQTLYRFLLNNFCNHADNLLPIR